MARSRSIDDCSLIRVLQVARNGTQGVPHGFTLGTRDPLPRPQRLGAQ